MIGILSDSHDNLVALRKAVSLFRDAGCELLVHAGDFIAPFAARELEKAGCPVKAVFGNCDGEKKGLVSALKGFGKVREAPWVFEHRGTRIFLAHLDGAVANAVAKRAYDIVIYGHTHKPEVRVSGPALVVNPGETGGWLSGKGTVALFDPATGRAEIIGIG
jgi:putative phosphoesterase